MITAASFKPEKLNLEKLEKKTQDKHYELDPLWYYTAPGLSWDALLKHSKVELELLSDPDMLLFLEEGTRGGISMISNRFGRANQRYMKFFNLEKENDLPDLSGRKQSLWLGDDPGSSRARG